MVDHDDAKKIVSLREHRLKERLNAVYASKLDAITARMYSDDEDIRRGALPTPHNQYRPGQRDDVRNCTFRRFSPAF